MRETVLGKFMGRGRLRASECLRGCCEAARDTSVPVPAPSATHHALLQRPLDAPSVCHREPDLGDGTLLGDVDVAHVQDVVNGLHLLHFDGPGVPVGSCFLQEALAVRLCLCDDLHQEQHTEKQGTLTRSSGTGARWKSSAILSPPAPGSLLWPDTLPNRPPS